MRIPLMGVEEEYLLVDPVTRQPVPAAARVVEEAAELGDRVGEEFTRLQVEARTSPCADAAALHDQLRGMRKVVAGAAERAGVRAVATGAPVLGPPGPPPVTEGERHEVGVRAYGALNDELSVCALHVHVEMPDRERAVLACNHVRPWLPVLIALAANSPFHLGRDTGHASWRPLTWGRWPVAGPPPYFTGAGDYDRLIAMLTTGEVLVDRGAIFWDVRPSERFPTVEIRVMDVPLDVRDSGLLAVLVRALAGTALAAIYQGDPGPQLSPELLRAAYWRAARDGLRGQALEPVTGRAVPMSDLVAELATQVRPALALYGDEELVEKSLGRLLASGSGATTQRTAYQRQGSLLDVVDAATLS